MLTLNPSRSALVLIDLQKGMTLTRRCFWCAWVGRRISPALKQPVDNASGGTLPANWWDISADLKAQDSDIRIIKRQWGAFYGTELEMQLRRRGIETIVLGGDCNQHWRGIHRA